MAMTTFLNSTVNTARRTRRAYIGAHVLAFEFARKRAAYRMEQIKTIGTLLVAKGEIMEKDAAEAVDIAKDKVAELLPKKAHSGVTVDVKPSRVAKKVKDSKKVDLSTDRTTTKKEALKKVSSPKAEINAAQAGEILADKYAPYIEGVIKYDAEANPVYIKKIVDHLGVALSSRDGKFVACSDPSERETVAKSWLLKKLGLEADMDALNAKVSAVCEEMKADRMKPRVTFYYLLAKHEGKLGSL